LLTTGWVLKFNKVDYESFSIFHLPGLGRVFHGAALAGARGCGPAG
jgi:hypothetical protein